MRGLKVKTMRRVARETGIVPREYLAKVRHVSVENPAFGKEGEPQFITVQRLQIVLGRCQRLMVQTLKRTCPKGSFFGIPLRAYRRGAPDGLAGMTITPVEAPQ